MNDSILFAMNPYAMGNGLCFVCSVLFGFATTRLYWLKFQKRGWLAAVFVGTAIGFCLMNVEGRDCVASRILFGAVAGLLGSLWFNVRNDARLRRAEREAAAEPNVADSPNAGEKSV